LVQSRKSRNGTDNVSFLQDFKSSTVGPAQFLRASYLQWPAAVGMFSKQGKWPELKKSSHFRGHDWSIKISKTSFVSQQLFHVVHKHSKWSFNVTHISHNSKQDTNDACRECIATERASFMVFLFCFFRVQFEPLGTCCHWTCLSLVQSRKTQIATDNVSHLQYFKSSAEGPVLILHPNYLQWPSAMRIFSK